MMHVLELCVGCSDEGVVASEAVVDELSRVYGFLIGGCECL